MSFKTGDIVLVKFPFTNLLDYKKRPVLVIKDENRLNDIICFQITSNPHQTNILKIEEEFLTKSLKLLSFIKYDKCFTIDSNSIDKKLSSIKPKYLQTIKQHFCDEIF